MRYEISTLLALMAAAPVLSTYILAASLTLTDCPDASTDPPEGTSSISGR
jgi:hypothetical protein